MDDDDELLTTDLFGGGGSKGKTANTLTTAAAFNPAAVFAPTMKTKAVKEEGGKGKANVSAAMGLESLESLLRTAKRQEKEVADVARNAYKGLAGQEGGEGHGEEGEEEEIEDEDLEKLQALVAETLKGGDDDAKGGKGKKAKKRQIFDDDDDDDDDEDGAGGGLEREEVGDWMGLASVFRMADPSSYPSLALPASLPEARTWGPEAQKLEQALLDAEAKGLLPDLLCLMGPARWLQATDATAPPGLLDWLLKLTAWHTDPAVSHGAYRTLKLLFRGEDGHGPHRKALQGWSLSFPLLQALLTPYGVRLLPSQAQQKGVYATFLNNPSSSSETTSTVLNTVGAPALGAADPRISQQQQQQQQPPMERSGVPPTVNLRGLLSVLSWCLRAGRAAFAGGKGEMAALLYALLVLGIDRYIQADCPEELRGAVAATLHAMPEESWATAMPAVLDAILPPSAGSPPPQAAAVRLGAASALHIARAALPFLLPTRSGDRARQLLTCLLRRVIEERVLRPLSPNGGEPSGGLTALLGFPTQTVPEKQAYLLRLLTALLGEERQQVTPLANPSCPEALAALVPAGNNMELAMHGAQGEGAEGTGLDRVLFLACALGMWAQLVGEGGLGAKWGLMPELATKLVRLERGKLRNHAEECVQTAKDILSQAASSMQALVPKGPTQMKLTAAFARKSDNAGKMVDDDDDDDE